jgi:hypothetical protein
MSEIGKRGVEIADDNESDGNMEGSRQQVDGYEIQTHDQNTVGYCLHKGAPGTHYAHPHLLFRLEKSARQFSLQG